MAHKIDEYRLTAYADGELDDESSREVEHALKADPALSLRVQELRSDTMLVRSAYQHLLSDPEVPGWLLRASRSEIKGDSGVVSKLWHRNIVLPWALAASLATLLIGGGVGQMLGNASVEATYSRAGLMTPEDWQTSDQTLKASLESDTSGTRRPWTNPDTGHSGEVTPIRTFKSLDGRFCREFAERATTYGTVSEAGGIACREPDSGWKVRLRYYRS